MHEIFLCDRNQPESQNVDFQAINIVEQNEMLINFNFLN